MPYLTYEEAKEKVFLEPIYPNGRNKEVFFQPAFTPAQMLQMGVFAGNYFGNPIATEEDFLGMDKEAEALARQNAAGRNVYAKSCFGVKAGMDYAWWKEKGMIWDEDPLGWFHWYCRRYNGRRHERDRKQIGRWMNFNRWLTTGKNQFIDDGKVSAVIMQSLLHWGYDPLECFRAEKKQAIKPPMPMGERE